MKLVIAMLFFSGLYALSSYYSRSISLKIISITTLIALSSLVYFSFESFRGWPTREVPRSGYVLHIEIIQPNREFAGAIYVWVIDESDKKVEGLLNKLITYEYEIKPAPRSYYLPYTKESNKMFGDAKKKIEDGFLVKIEGIEGEGEDSSQQGQSSSDKKGKGKSKGDTHMYEVPSLRILSPDEVLKK